MTSRAGATAAQRQPGEDDDRDDGLRKLSVGAHLAHVVKRLEEGPRHIRTGFPRLDAALGGGLLQPSFTVLGAPPKSGKSILAQMVGVQNVEAEGVTYILDVENGTQRGMRRLLGRRAQLGAREVAQAIRDEQVDRLKSRDAVERWHEAKRWLDGLSSRFFYEFRPPANLVTRIAAVARAAEGRPLLIVIDSLQKLAAISLREDRRLVIDGLVRTLEQLREQHEAAFLVVSEIRRGRDGYVATEDAFKESGGIEYGADLGLLLNRPADDPKTPSTLSVAFAREADEDPRGPVASYEHVYPWYGLREVEPVPFRAPTRGPKPTKRQAAKVWLRSFLASGPRDGADVYAGGDKVGHKKGTLDNAAKELEVKRDAGTWSLPT